MKELLDINQTIRATETASIENTGSQKLSLSLICSNGCKMDIELFSAQVLEFTAGTSDAKIVLHHGDPADLLIIKPESAS